MGSGKGQARRGTAGSDRCRFRAGAGSTPRPKDSHSHSHRSSHRHSHRHRHRATPAQGVGRPPPEAHGGVPDAAGGPPPPTCQVLTWRVLTWQRQRAWGADLAPGKASVAAGRVGAGTGPGGALTYWGAAEAECIPAGRLLGRVSIRAGNKGCTGGEEEYLRGCEEEEEEDVGFDSQAYPPVPHLRPLCHSYSL